MEPGSVITATSETSQLFGHIFQYAWAKIGLVLTAGGGGAAVAWLFFSAFGKNWLSQHFKKELEQIRADGKKEIELLRHTINSEYSRISKIHDKEFEVLPKAWELLHHAFGNAYSMTRGMKYCPEFDRMSDRDFADFISESKLSDSIKQRLMEAPNKSQYYREHAAVEELTKAKKSQIELNNYLYLNSIFMTDELRVRFQGMNKAISSALISWEVGKTADDRSMVSESSRQIGELSDKFAEVERAVQQRLLYEKA